MIEKRFIDVFEMIDGSVHRIPLMIKRGPEKGPKLFLTAALHGEEVTGMEVIHRLFEYVRLKRGTIYALPVVNLAGFQLGVRYYPYYNADPNTTDYPNLNKVFPGRIDGEPAEKLAYTVYQTITNINPDLLIDLHCDAHNSIAYILLDRLVSGSDKELECRTQKLAEAFGVTVCRDDTPEGYIENEGERSLTGAVFNKSRIPAFVVELGGPTMIREGFVRIGTSGLKNILSVLGMLEGPQERWESDTRVRADYPLRTHDIFVSQRFGKMSYRVGVGRPVKVGDLIATVEDIFGVRKEEVRTDRDGYVLNLGYQVLSSPGMLVAILAVRDETAKLG